MKNLFLLRHAKSSWANSELRDFDRPLNKRGKRDAPRMSSWFGSLETFNGLIISSPAKRAKSTAEVMARELGVSLQENDGLYTFSNQNIFEELIWTTPEEYEDLMLVGHNEIISAVANDFCDSSVDRMVTCSLVCLEFDVKSWSEVQPGTGNKRFHAYPKMFRDA